MKPRAGGWRILRAARFLFFGAEKSSPFSRARFSSASAWASGPGDPRSARASHCHRRGVGCEADRPHLNTDDPLAPLAARLRRGNRSSDGEVLSRPATTSFHETNGDEVTFRRSNFLQA